MQLQVYKTLKLYISVKKLKQITEYNKSTGRQKKIQEGKQASEKNSSMNIERIGEI